MKDLCIVLVVIAMMAFSLRYAYQVRKRTINPTLSTWIIYFLGTGLSLTTYAIAENHDFRSGILNAMDFVAVTIDLIAILLWGNRQKIFVKNLVIKTRGQSISVWGSRLARLRPFEKWYLAGAGAIIVYGLISGDAFKSNLFAQVLVSFGCFPTIQTLYKFKRNTESFSAWGCGLLAGIFGLYPAFMDGNGLAAFYAVRTVFLVSLILIIMAYYERRSKATR